jgi:hypothetical protein
MDSSGWRGNRISSLSIGSLSLCARGLLLCSAVLPATLTPRLVLRLIWAVPAHARQAMAFGAVLAGTPVLGLKHLSSAGSAKRQNSIWRGPFPRRAGLSQSICSVHQADLRLALIPTVYARTPARCEQQHSGDMTMLTKSQIALSFAAVLGATSVFLTTHAFAQNHYPEFGRYEPGSKNGRTDKLQMNLDQRWKGVREERSRELGPPLRWIDNPASPGG